jgi:F0F1-type ATP synthase assembly protein I
MPFIAKLLLTNAIIIACARIGARSPSLGGLIATMPLTSLIVLIWLRVDNPKDNHLLAAYTRGVLWGIIPTILFFLVAYLCLRRELPFLLTLGAGFAVWLVGALVHQWLVK